MALLIYFESYKNRRIQNGQKVRVYKNLNLSNQRGQNTPVYSIQDADTKSVLGHSECVMLENIVFKVYQKGRDKVIETGHKNVHAYIIGTYMADNRNNRKTVEWEGQQALYNPFLYTEFVNYENGSPVRAARSVVVGPYGVYFI